MTAIIDVQGFKGLTNKFIVKELAILTDGNQMQHFVFQPPFRFKDLTIEKRREAKWLCKNYHGFCWDDGYIPYHQMYSLIAPILKDKTIYVKGCQKARWLQDIFSNITVHDMEDELQCPNLSYLQFLNSNVQRCLIHNGRCAQQNVCLLRNFLESNQNKIFE